MFGRGSEEAEYLVRNNINVEVVPGITSGMAAPAYCGIPLTHRKAGSSVTFVTGHEIDDKNKSPVNWRALATGTDGIVIYMGMHNLNYIVKELISGGLDPETPSAIIHQGTLSGQKFIKSTLKKLTSKRDSIEISSPSIVMIGNVIDFQIEECSPKPSKLGLLRKDQLVKLKNTHESKEFLCGVSSFY
tara:strand:- start:367 stop:930 length:564 start_codon:yes stop_codon:yes gene_type:complete